MKDRIPILILETTYFSGKSSQFQEQSRGSKANSNITPKKTMLLPTPSCFSALNQQYDLEFSSSKCEDMKTELNKNPWNHLSRKYVMREGYIIFLNIDKYMLLWWSREKWSEFLFGKKIY